MKSPVPYTGPPILDGQEHYPDCGCGRCQRIRETTHNTHWTKLNTTDRIKETLAAKLEGNNGHLPERGMFNCADIAELLKMVNTHD